MLTFLKFITKSQKLISTCETNKGQYKIEANAHQLEKNILFEIVGYVF
jgi:hypothetical protein